MRRNDTDINVLSDKLEAFIGKLALYIRKLGVKTLDVFSRLKNFVEQNSVETSDTEIDRLSKVSWLICNPGFLSIFQTHYVINTNGLRIHSMLIRPRSTTFLLMNKKTILTYI
jgi:hypothetical protein